MNEKDAKILLSGILNNDENAVGKIVSAYFESALKRKMSESTKSLMESIGKLQKPVV